MRTFEVVLAHIEEGLLSGRFTVGSTLPAERDLAAQLGVSRSAVREAIRALEAQGVLDPSVGAGPASGTRVTGRQSAALSRLLKLHVILGKYQVDQVVEARILLERGSVRLAARNASAAELERIGAVLTAMDDAHTVDTFNPLDTRFHVVIAEVGANQLVTDLTVAIREALLRPIAEASDEMTAWPAFRAGLVEQHREIFAALTARDEAAAADAVERHIRSAYASLGSARGPDRSIRESGSPQNTSVDGTPRNSERPSSLSSTARTVWGALS